MHVTMKSTLIALLAASASARTIVSNAANAQWLRAARATPDTELDMVVAIAQPASGKQELLAALMRSSDPASSLYGRHMPHAQLDALLQPTAEASNNVTTWLAAAGMIDMTFNRNGDMIRGRLTVAAAERLLSAQYHVYTHSNGVTRPIVRCESITLPQDISPFIDFIGPSTRFPATSSLRLSPPSASPAAGVDPTYIRTQYNIGAVESKSASNRQQAAGFLGEFAALADLQAFYNQFYPVAKGRSLTIVGPNDQSNPGLEASLDVQYVTSVGGGVNTTFWYTDGTRPYDNEPYAVWLANVTSLPLDQQPLVISVSYGDNEDTVDISYADRVNVEFQKLGATGSSIIFSSGDGGVGGSQPTSCTTFVPTFPAASPYVTAVGATDNSSPQVAASFSSGGFSNYWARPSYQTAAVAQYFKVARNLPPSNLYNATGAGFPDVAAFGTSFNIVTGGSTLQVDGTSCSAPTFAGVISLLNDLRLQAGKSTLGWLNPLLYASPSVFTDVTQGSNPGCSSTGFFAAVGWDPITGLGTPDYAKMQKLVLSLP